MQNPSINKETVNTNAESRWFGERAVEPDEKTSLVRGVFDSVASRYDIMNDAMSGGLHRLWKNHFVRKIRPKSGLHYLDVAGGTGDIAFRIHQKVSATTPITLCDLNDQMLRTGRNRAINRGLARRFDWVTGNAETLPFQEESMDVYTIAFGLRNVTRIDTALSEAFRVLKPGGRFYCLEFSQVNEPLLSHLYDLYSYKVIPVLGEMIAQDRESYQYLVESIRNFPTRDGLLNRMEAAGFRQTFCESLSFGVVAIHSGIKN